MKENNLKVWRIFAGIMAFVLIFGILFITNAFVGNPLSAKLAEKTINKYIEEKYPGLDLEVDKAIYNFKDASYGVKVKSRTSIDTQFHISYIGGEIYNDSYESDVLGMFNTLDRLSTEYTTLVRDMIAKDLAYKNNETWVNYDDSMYENPSHLLELDMKFDRELPIPATVTMNIEMDKPSLNEARDILVNAHELFKKNRCYFEEYSLFSKSEKIRVSIMGVKPRDIEDSKFLDLLKEAAAREDEIIVEEGQDKDGEAEGIYVEIRKIED